MRRDREACPLRAAEGLGLCAAWGRGPSVETPEALGVEGQAAGCDDPTPGRGWEPQRSRSGATETFPGSSA